MTFQFACSIFLVREWLILFSISLVKPLDLISSFLYRTWFKINHLEVIILVKTCLSVSSQTKSYKKVSKMLLNNNRQNRFNRQVSLNYTLLSFIEDTILFWALNSSLRSPFYIDQNWQVASAYVDCSAKTETSLRVIMALSPFIDVHNFS